MSRPTPEITLEELAAAHEDGTTVDVRERGEYSQGTSQAQIASGRAVGVGL